MPAIRDAGKYWIPSIQTFPADVCRGSSCFHAVLIVLLRCVAIISPINFETWHKRLTKISIAVIWMYMLVLWVIPVAITTDFFTQRNFTLLPKSKKDARTVAWKAFNHGSVTVPIFLLIIMYIVLVYILKYESANDSQTVSRKKKSLAKMTTAITIGTLICYLPFIIYYQYRYTIIQTEGYHRATEIYNTTGGVS